jgi:serine/threonine-protein kinase HipA
MRFFELAVFNYVIGNNDMHLKNFSMWLTGQGWTLSPAYDLLNVKTILPKDKEDTALLLGGKKRNFNKGYFDGLGGVLKLNEKQINGVYKRLEKWLPKATSLIEKSFLTEEYKKAYQEMVTMGVKRFESEKSN